MQPVSALLATLLLLPLVLPGEIQLVRTVSNLVNESGICQCVVHLPNNSILLQQLEKLQSTVQELFGKYEQERSRASEYVQAIDDNSNQALEMGSMSESRNPRAFVPSFETSAFNLLSLEFERMQELATQLMAEGGVNGSTDLLHQLQEQVTYASLTLRLLGDTEWRSSGALQWEVDVLKGRLRAWEREREHDPASRYSGAHRPPGSCAHGGLQKVSSPLVLQLNWRGLFYKAGAWGRDSAPSSTSSLYWVAPLRPDGRNFDYYWLQKSFDDLMLLKNYEEWKMGYGDGSGNTVYKNFMYFNYYGTSDMAKVDLSSNTLVLRRPLPGATHGNRFSYAGVSWKDLDFAGDEKGLWVLYATEQSKGNLVVSLLNASTLEVEETWHTSQYKPGLSGPFMACGVLYALRSLSTRQEEIFYAFDTSTGKETHLSILLDKMLETLHGINYCSSDHKLYAYNDGFLVNHDLTFSTLEHKPPRLPAPRRSGVLSPPKPVKPNEHSRP
ncbi:olfactomedin-4 [Fukomys damarensis]|uniref:olfactomedin-4 n=1 Tax=Fukomys damarensis TaxID=885580 RepID=UPI00053F5F05|nr:olfactomedin-4 [Fukomys damarensis]